MRRAGRAGGWVVAAPVVVALIGGWGGSASGADRVVGGNAIQVQSAPWAVFVQNQAASENDDCSGSIVDALHVVTAAHCVFDSAGALASPSQLSVTAGVSNVADPLPTDLEQQRSVGSFTVHPGYAYSTTPGPDDVAVLALASPLDLSGPAVRAVALPDPGGPFPAGAGGVEAGFGEEAPGVDPSGQLNSLTGTVDAQGSCGLGVGIADDAVRFCALSTNGSTCEGDSGSGLVTTGSTPTLVGVLSAGSPGCGVGSHSVYDDVSAPEILSFIQGNQQPPTAPRAGSATFVKIAWLPPLVVGTRLTCSTGAWSDQPTSYAYAFVDTGDDQVLQEGASPTFEPGPADVHDTIACTAFATNAGGTAAVTTMPTAAVGVRPASTPSPSVPVSPSLRGGVSAAASAGSAGARQSSAEAIEATADAIPTPPIRSGAWVAVPEWDAYLRQALLGNQNPAGPGYRDTYVRCWSSASWARGAAAATPGRVSFADATAVLGFYVPGSSWINLPLATCAAAARAARGALDPASVVALGSVLHEAFNRQGRGEEADATCLGAVGVWQAFDRHAGTSPADHAWALLLGWYAHHLGHAAAAGLAGCASRLHASWNA